MRALRILQFAGLAIVVLVLVLVGAFAPMIAYVILGDEAGQKWALLMGIAMQFIVAVIADGLGHCKRRSV